MRVPFWYAHAFIYFFQYMYVSYHFGMSQVIMGCVLIQYVNTIMVCGIPLKYGILYQYGTYFNCIHVLKWYVPCQNGMPYLNGTHVLKRYVPYQKGTNCQCIPKRYDHTVLVCFIPLFFFCVLGYNVELGCRLLWGRSTCR